MQVNKSSENKNWKSVISKFKQIGGLEKEDSDRNMKIEAALNAQGRKTTIPAEAHEVLHDWYQSKGKSLLTPEQSSKLKAIKEPKEKRSQFKIVKSNEELNDLQKSLVYLKEAINSDLFKAKTIKSEWQPSKQYSPADHAAMKPHIDQGHSLQEAAHLSGVEPTPQNHGFRMPELTPAMAAKAKAAALDWIGRSKQIDAREASAATNPEKFMTSKAAEIGSTAASAAKSYGESLKEHKASISNLSPEDQIKSIQNFKADYHASPAAKMAHVDAAKAHSDIANDARNARGQELYEQRKNILLGGQGLGNAMATSTGSALDAEDEPLNQQDLEDIHNGQ
jgi:hypothetical protein